MTFREQSFLAQLLTEEAMVKALGQKEGPNSAAGIAEVQRQIKQIMETGNWLNGEGVTKSGEED